MVEQSQPKRDLQPKGAPTGIRLIGSSFARAARDTARTLAGLFRGTILVTLPAGLLQIVLMGWILPLYGWPIPDDLWGQWPRPQCRRQPIEGCNRHVFDKAGRCNRSQPN